MIKSTLLIGLGKTGFSIARFLKSNQKAFIAYDTRSKPPELEKFQEMFPDVTCYCHDYPHDLLEHVDKIICSPGVPLHEEILQEAMAKGILIENDLDCLMRLINAPVIGITGSNGKSTVTTLVGLMCQAQGFKTAVGGNLGTPVLELYEQNPQADIWVLELSSFQLLHMQNTRLSAATILNVSADHIDYHGSMEAYVAAKQRIYEQTEMLIFNRHDELTLPKIHAKHQESFGLSQPEKYQWGVIQTAQGEAIAFEDEIFILTKDLKLQGHHNWLNVMASCALARYVGVSKSTMIQVLQEFSGLAHRTQWVAHTKGVTYINDSKGTNLGATFAALEGMGPTLQGQMILIAGGQAKGADLTAIRPLLEKYVRHVVLIGQDADLISTQWHGAVSIERAASLKEAVDIASHHAKVGDMVLLSPACASLDMFKNFEDRGTQFMALVKGLNE